MREKHEQDSCLELALNDLNGFDTNSQALEHLSHLCLKTKGLVLNNSTDNIFNIR